MWRLMGIGALALCVGCDIVDQVEDQLDTQSSGGDATNTADGTATGTSAATDTTTPTPLNVDVGFTTVLRSVTANGQQYVEGNFTWNARGAADLRVDVQIKTQVSYPDWTNLLTNQDPVDVGTAPINGPDRAFNFRAVAYQASAPETKYYSDIITIQ